MTSAPRGLPLSNAISPKKSPLPSRTRWFGSTTSTAPEEIRNIALPRSPLRITFSSGTSSLGHNRWVSALQFGRTQAGEHIELSEQVLGAQPKVERRQLVHQRADRRVLPLQILEDLLADQPLLVEIIKS